jgi:hypothetical protein
MIEKKIAFKDLADKDVEDTFFFNLTGAEVTELAMTRQGLDEYLREIIKTEDVAKLWETFKELLGMAVGSPLSDRVFDKNPRITAEFMRSGAYEEFFFELIADPSYAAKFVTSIMPANLEERINKIVASGGEEKKEYTNDELLTLSDDEFFKAAGGSNPMKWEPRFLQLGYQRRSAA